MTEIKQKFLELLTKLEINKIWQLSPLFKFMDSFNEMKNTLIKCKDTPEYFDLRTQEKVLEAQVKDLVKKAQKLNINRTKRQAFTDDFF